MGHRHRPKEEMRYPTHFMTCSNGGGEVFRHNNRERLLLSKIATKRYSTPFFRTKYRYSKLLPKDFVPYLGMCLARPSRVPIARVELAGEIDRTGSSTSAVGRMNHPPRAQESHCPAIIVGLPSSHPTKFRKWRNSSDKVQPSCHAC